MKTFEDLGLSSKLCKVLKKNALNIPFELQRDIIPLISRNNNLLIESGPGAGTFITYALPLLDKIVPGLENPRAIVITPTQDTSSQLARVMGQLAIATGHTISAMGSNWVSPETADIIFGTPADLLTTIDESQLSTQNISTLVVDRANSIEVTSDFDALKELLGYIGNKPQKVVFSLPITDSIRKIVSQHVPKCIEMSTTSKKGTAEGDHQIQKMHYLIGSEEKEEALLWLLKKHFTDRSRKLMIFVHTAAGANELIAFLRLYGFLAGNPGDSASYIWVGTTDQKSQAQEATDEKRFLATISFDCPEDTVVMEDCHGESKEAVVVLLAREIPHFRQLTSTLSYETQALNIKPATRIDPLSKIRDDLTNQLSSQDLAPYYAILEPMLETYDPLELSAASLSLASLPQSDKEIGPKGQPVTAPHDNHDWTRLFVSLGTIEGITPSTLLGALAGESGVDGSAFGKIDIRETFSLVEVRASEANKVIKTVNGVTIRGRSTRVDYDRARKTNEQTRRRG